MENTWQRRWLWIAIILTLAVTITMIRETTQASSEASCQTFTSQTELNSSKNRIARLISGMPDEDVVAWITGVRPAPLDIQQEIDAHAGCLLAAMGASTQDIISWRRDANAQARIWNRKYEFLRSGEGGTGPFGRITENSRAQCGSLLEAATGWDPDNDKHRTCWFSLSSKQRQVEILQTSAAPGISRHHWGTDLDLFSDNPIEWADDGPRQPEYRLLQAHGARHGFIQPYTSASTKPSFIEERWHWSYYPVSQALLEFIRVRQNAVEDQLLTLWKDHPERFTYIHQHWQDYTFHVNEQACFCS